MLFDNFRPLASTSKVWRGILKMRQTLTTSQGTVTGTSLLVGCAIVVLNKESKIYYTRFSRQIVLVRTAGLCDVAPERISHMSDSVAALAVRR